MAGRFDLGPPWAWGRTYASQLVIAPGVSVHVSGHMSIYTGFQLWVNPNARLVIGSGIADYGLRVSGRESTGIGLDCALEERVSIPDSDDYQVTGGGRPSVAPVTVGDHG